MNENARMERVAGEKREKRLVTIDDILSLKQLSAPEISADGRAIAFVVGDSFRVDTKSPKSNIWVAEKSQVGGEWNVRAFTSGPRKDFFPKWSPDGRQLAFLSDRVEEEKFQIYVMNRDGGEARQLTEVKGDIGQSVIVAVAQSISWTPDGRKIAFLMSDPETDEEARKKKEKLDAIAFEKNHKFTRIWTVDVATKATKQITRDFQVWEFNFSNDGNTIAAIVSDEPYEWSWYLSNLALISIDDGSARILFRPKPRQLARPLWSGDGKSVYFISSIWSDRNVVAGDLFMISADGSGRVKNLTEGYKGSVTWMEWLSPDELLLSCLENTNTVFAKLNVNSGAIMRKIWEGAIAMWVVYWQKFSIHPSSQTIAIIGESLASAPEVWAGRIANDESTIEWAVLTSLNSMHKSLELGSAKFIEWPSFDGTRIQGFLFLPPNSKAGGKVPMVVSVHGGPSFGYGCSYTYCMAQSAPAYFLASNGYAVLLPNPRGSTGRGLEFTESNRGDFGGGDFKDIMAGVDYCISTGIADPQRLYIMGGSYGGFMTAWAVTQTNRFKAAIMLYGVSDWVSVHGTGNLSAWDRNHLNADPYEAQGTHWRASPISHVKKVSSPTLIICGELDPCCPPSQSLEFFRGLKENNVETELVIYPREAHGCREKQHMIDNYARYLDWLKRH
jgi:dipeptidyl aminopeptidase/acylaminoacyl peptidase